MSPAGPAPTMHTGSSFTFSASTACRLIGDAVPRMKTTIYWQQGGELQNAYCGSSRSYTVDPLAVSADAQLRSTRDSISLPNCRPADYASTPSTAHKVPIVIVAFPGNMRQANVCRCFHGASVVLCAPSQPFASMRTRSSTVAPPSLCPPRHLTPPARSYSTLAEPQPFPLPVPCPHL